MDTSRLTELRFGKASIEPEQLTSLIERATNLCRIELAFLCCGGGYLGCNGTRLDANKQLLLALASHENLTAIKFKRIGLNDNTKCMDFEREFIDMLKTIGRRGKLRKLALEKLSRPAFIPDYIPPHRSEYIPESYIPQGDNEICTTIRDYLPYLQSIKLYGNHISSENICHVVGLTELEDICMWRQTTPNIVKTIAQLPRLKRLAIGGFYEVGDGSPLKCLADAPALTDLRIRHGHSITADIYDKWSDGLASNLQCLMLSGVAEGDEHDEERLARMLEKSIRLRILILQGRITDQSLMAIAKSCPNLEIFGVRSTLREIDARQLQAIVDGCPKLQKLGGICDEIWKQVQLPKYRNVGEVGIEFWNYDFDDNEFPNEGIGVNA